MDTMLYDFEPDVFLITDDGGATEVFIMQYLEHRKIPIVFMPHGPAFGCLSKEKFQIKERKAQDWVNRDYHLPCVNPIGCNGKYLICSFSDLLKQFQINYGVDPAIIRYFERIKIPVVSPRQLDFMEPEYQSRFFNGYNKLVQNTPGRLGWTINVLKYHFDNYCRYRWPAFV
ncbi:unnamed protein product, partial [marine sediment metagenome]